MKTWNGTFTEDEAFLTKAFETSIHCDKHFWKHDILVSMAHVKMLAKSGVISQDDCDAILVHMQELLWDMEAGRINFSAEDESIHKAILNILSVRIGALSSKIDLYRNEAQYTALVFRFYLKDAINDLLQQLQCLEKKASAKSDTSMYSCMLKRDITRLENCLAGTDCIPFSKTTGSSEEAFSIDPDFLKTELGFSKVCLCDRDGAGDRDFAIEFLSCASMTMMHLSQLSSQLAKDGVFARPQIVSGKAGKVYGILFSLLTTLQSLPPEESSGFYEDKDAVVNAFETMKSCIIVLKKSLE